MSSDRESDFVISFFYTKTTGPIRRFVCFNLHFTEWRWTKIHHPTFWTWRFYRNLRLGFVEDPSATFAWSFGQVGLQHLGGGVGSHLMFEGEGGFFRRQVTPRFFWPFYVSLKVIDRESSAKRMSALVKVYEKVFLFWNGLFVQDIVEVPKCSLWRLLVWRPILYALPPLAIS